MLACLCALGPLAGCQVMQRGALFHPTHHQRETALDRWEHAGAVIGYVRRVPAPRSVWLLLHGNTGQASDRVYALPVFPAGDSVHVLEYPGYGARPGRPSRRTLDAAALEAYRLLRAQFPGTPVCIAAESIGSGPASMLSQADPPPDKLVFFVPFDDLKSVGRHYAPHAPLGLLLAGTWNNVEALSGYAGPMEVFGAERDEVIPVQHARALAASRPQAKFRLLPGAHNEWSRQPQLGIRCP
jgi:pimeloyl-ACP methyl ester carboxylesterase